ncbi:MAG: retropepsin-like aspartic protease [Pseudomonadales bacterium]
MRVVLWSALLLLVGFACGWFAGRWWGAAEVVTQVAPAAGAARGAAMAELAHADAGAHGPATTTSLEPWLSRGDWSGLVAEHSRLVRAGADAAAATLRRALLAKVQDWLRSSDRQRGADLLDAFLVENPLDVDALLLESAARQMQGQLEAALDPLLELLGGVDDPAAVAEAREQMRLIVNVLEAQLVSRRDYPGLVRLFDTLTLRDPAFDGHRLELARWQLRTGALEDARRTLSETGLVGVTPEQRADLETQLHFALAAAEGIPVERSDGALYVPARMGGNRVRLLVDTGATTTVVSAAVAARLGGEPLPNVVRVRTAAGIVEARVLRVRDVQIGGLGLDALDVLVLDQAPPEADGLLGMDVLSRLEPLLGTPPRSG